MKELQEKYQVKKDQTALAMGSGDLEVLATPALVAMMENCAKNLLAAELTAGQTSVGFKMALKHLAPTAVGAEVTVKAELVALEKSKADFSIEAYAEDHLIGQATHQRVIVETAVFLKKMK